MAGETGPHSLIGISIAAVLHSQLSRQGRQVHGADMRISVPSVNRFAYADVVIPDGDPDYVAPNDSLANPHAMVEVLSAPSKGYDRGDKFDRYCAIDTFREYTLVSQHRPRIECFFRQNDGNWLREVHTDAAGAVKLQSVNCQLAEVYGHVDFDQAERNVYSGDPEGESGLRRRVWPRVPHCESERKHPGVAGSPPRRAACTG